MLVYASRGRAACSGRRGLPPAVAVGHLLWICHSNRCCRLAMVVIGCILTHTSLGSPPDDLENVWSALETREPRTQTVHKAFGACRGHATPSCPLDLIDASMHCVMCGVGATKPQGPSQTSPRSPIVSAPRAHPTRMPNGPKISSPLVMGSGLEMR